MMRLSYIMSLTVNTFEQLTWNAHTYVYIHKHILFRLYNSHLHFDNKDRRTGKYFPVKRMLT